jgi:hypothetical protein
MTPAEEFFQDTRSATPLCDAEIERLQKHYDPIVLSVVFVLARKLEVRLAIANNNIVDLHNRIEALEEKAAK